MIEYLILIIPILVIGSSIYQKVFRAEESAITFINSRSKYGVKGYILRTPFVFLVYVSFITSSLFTPLGIYWAALGAVLLFGTIIYLIFSDGVMFLPNLVSPEFDALVLKRKKQAVVSSLMVLLWIVSWWV